MDYIITLQDKMKVPITNEEKNLILKASMKNARAYQLDRTGEVIGLRPFPSIVLKSRYDAEDKKKMPAKMEYLPTAQEMMQKKMGKDRYLEYQKDIAKIGAAMSIPELSYDEQLAARAEGGEPKAKAILSGKYEDH